MEILFFINCIGELLKIVYSIVKVNWIINKIVILKWIVGLLCGKMMGLIYFVFWFFLSFKFILKDFWFFNLSVLFDLLFLGYFWDDDFLIVDL